jgi:outer membrane lipoprotein carrier protein
MWNHFLFLFLSFFTDQAGNGESDRVMAPEAPLVESATIKKDTPSKKAPKKAPKASKEKLAPAMPDESPSHYEIPSYVPVVAVAPTADDAIAKVQAFYNKTQSFTATFTQTVTNQTFNKRKPRVSKGRVYILKPGKMRWDYKNKAYKKVGDPKVSKSFISDSKHLWVVLHKNKQYYKEVLADSTLPVAVSFLMGTGDLRKDFNVSFDTAGKYGSKTDLLLLLTPKKPSARYKKLWLVIDPADHSVKQSVVLNIKGDINQIRFSGAKTNVDNLKNGHFIFNAKAHKDFRLMKAPEAPKR